MKRVIGYQEILRRDLDMGEVKYRIGFEPIYEDLGVRSLTTMDWNVEPPKPPMDANKYIWGKER